jgi:ankyrin repeat protein
MRTWLMALLLQFALIVPASAESPSTPHLNSKASFMEKSEEFYDAAVNADLEKLKELLMSDPSLIRTVDKYGFTALHGAAGEDNTKVVDFLLSAGASINAKNHEGVSPLHVAVNPEMAAFLVKRGADINLPDANGDTPLHTFAAEAQGLEVMRVLLSAGAKPDVKNNHGQTPTDIAIARDELDKAELINKFKK